MTITIGIDVSKANITCCKLDKYPGNLKDTFKRLSKNTPENFPTFWSIKNQKHQLKSIQDFKLYLEKLKEQDNHIIALLEPTGVHYSKLWALQLQKLDIEVKWIGHLELGRYRRGKELPNKTDAADALALAAYYWDEDKWLEGKIKPECYLIIYPEILTQLRELERQLNNLTRVQSPIINYLRQRLSYEFPEYAFNETEATEKYLPPLWCWLANRQDGSKAGLTRVKRAYEKSIAQELGIKISETTKLYANLYCEILEQELKLKAEIIELLTEPIFEPYLKALSKVIGYNNWLIKARLITRCYPFETFLSTEGKEVIEYEYREVKKYQKERTRQGKRYVTEVKAVPGEIKRIKRNRSRDSFFSRLGMATRIEQSGDKLIEVSHGSQICRTTLWQFVYSSIENGNLRSDRASQLFEEYDKLKGIISDKDSEEVKQRKLKQAKLNGRHIESKMMSKVTHLIYKELLHEFKL